MEVESLNTVCEKKNNNLKLLSLVVLRYNGLINEAPFSDWLIKTAT